MEALAIGSGSEIRFSLTRGFVTVVDAERFESMLTYRFRNGIETQLRPSSIQWHAAINRNYFYASSKLRVGSYSGPVVLHRLLTEAPSALFVDHISGDTMDNRLANLRICTAAENARNCRKYKCGTSRFKGVRLRRGKWTAQWHWQENGVSRCRSLGSFATEEDAARAYDARAIQEFGEFARLNFPQEAAPISS